MLKFSFRENLSIFLVQLIFIKYGEGRSQETDKMDKFSDPKMGQFLWPENDTMDGETLCLLPMCVYYQPSTIGWKYTDSICIALHEAVVVQTIRAGTQQQAGSTDEEFFDLPVQRCMRRGEQVVELTSVQYQ